MYKDWEGEQKENNILENKFNDLSMTRKAGMANMIKSGLES